MLYKNFFLFTNLALIGCTMSSPLIDKPSRSNAAELKEFSMQTCAIEPGKGATPKNTGNPAARKAAENGLAFLAKEAVSWQERNQCYGCHVQAVTIEAMSVGFKNQYEFDQKAFQSIVEGTQNLRGGSRGAEGLSHSPSITPAAKMMGGPAFARYDEWVNNSLQDDLLLTAEQILAYQQADGSSVSTGWTNAPVGLAGGVQWTALSILTWKQAYERSADTQWLTAIGRAEDYLQGWANQLDKKPPTTIQDANYAAMGLLAAGVAPSEKVLENLTKYLLSLQQEDGSWVFATTQGASAGKESKPFATGQTLYTLRLLGMTDEDTAISKGTGWLIEYQKEDGGWSSSGFGKAEAMWAILGLVSIDVLTVAVNGIKDGQHLSEDELLTVEAKDNKGVGVSKIQVLIDDLLIFGGCGSSLKYAWDTRTLSSGKHILTIVATNALGETSKRRFEVYAGDVFLTQIGSKYQSGAMAFSLRNIAPEKMTNTVQVKVFSTTEKEGAAKADKEVSALSQNGAQGSMNFKWDGKDAKGDVQPKGKYIAQLSFVDAQGKVRQTEEHMFVYDSQEAQAAAYGEFEGVLKLDGAGAAENATVNLVDEDGNVVQTTTSTKSGSYRFKNVEDGKKYSIQVQKDGYEAAAPMPAAKSEKNKKNQADVMLKKK
jgi:flagellar hook assembly protein FlgD